MLLTPLYLSVSLSERNYCTHCNYYQNYNTTHLASDVDRKRQRSTHTKRGNYSWDILLLTRTRPSPSDLHEWWTCPLHRQLAVHLRPGFHQWQASLSCTNSPRLWTRSVVICGKSPYAGWGGGRWLCHGMASTGGHQILRARGLLWLRRESPSLLHHHLGTPAITV